MKNDRTTKKFEITTSPEVMIRFERFLALLHHNSVFGHSGMFAMPLDGDGADKFTVDPKPKYAREVELCAGIGGDIEVAYNSCYTVFNKSILSTSWMVKPTATLYKNSVAHRTIPSSM